jgi:hypothetical protein
MATKHLLRVLGCAGVLLQAQMNAAFQQNQLKPGDPGYEYDKQVLCVLANDCQRAALRHSSTGTAPLCVFISVTSAAAPCQGRLPEVPALLDMQPCMLGTADSSVPALLSCWFNQWFCCFSAATRMSDSAAAFCMNACCMC